MSELLDKIKKWCDLALDSNCATTMYKYELVDILNYINKLQQENKQLKEEKKKAIDWCNEIIRTFCEDDKQVVVAYEIKEILGDKENAK